MGERGLPARLLAPRYGALLTFGALAAGRESAPGAASLVFPLLMSQDTPLPTTYPLLPTKPTLHIDATGRVI